MDKLPPLIANRRGAALGGCFEARREGEPERLPLSEMRDRAARACVETHPAVALAALWVELQVEAPFPRYKGSKAVAGAPAAIAKRLGFPEEAGEDDDTLDAFMAYRLGVQLLNGEARFIGHPGTGGYLLPANRAASEIQPL